MLGRPLEIRYRHTAASRHACRGRCPWRRKGDISRCIRLSSDIVGIQLPFNKHAAADNHTVGEEISETLACSRQSLYACPAIQHACKSRRLYRRWRDNSKHARLSATVDNTKRD